MQRRRVVITGLGVITSLGENADEMWENVCAGKSGVSLIRRWDTSKYPVRIGGECYGFDPKRYIAEVKDIRRMDRFSHFAMAASMGAVKDAGVDFGAEDGDGCGGRIGGGIGRIETGEQENEVLISRGVERVSPVPEPRP